MFNFSPQLISILRMSKNSSKSPVQNAPHDQSVAAPRATSKRVTAPSASSSAKNQSTALMPNAHARPISTRVLPLPRIRSDSTRLRRLWTVRWRPFKTRINTVFRNWWERRLLLDWAQLQQNQWGRCRVALVRWQQGIWYVLFEKITFYWIYYSRRHCQRSQHATEKIPCRHAHARHWCRRWLPNRACCRLVPIPRKSVEARVVPSPWKHWAADAQVHLWIVSEDFCSNSLLTILS